MKRKIIIQRGANDTLNFFLISQKSKRFIFSQKFSLSEKIYFLSKILFERLSFFPKRTLRKRDSGV